MTNKIVGGLIALIAVVFILIYAKTLILPFVVALFLWFVIKEIRTVLQKVKFIREKIPGALINAVSFIIIFSVLYGAISILTNSVNNLAENSDIYSANIETIYLSINELLGIDLRTELGNVINELNFGKLINNVVSSLSSIVGKVFLILIYTLFLLMEEKFFRPKLHNIYPNKERYESVRKVIKQADHKIGRYITLKTFVSLVTGILSYIALLIIGVDSPIFWAFLIFMFNYIPTVGSLVATAFPFLFALLQFGDFTTALWVLASVGGIQIIIGNLVDPKVMGDSLNVSPLVVLLSLAFWGMIWGVLGMFLSVPITVMLIIIFSQFEQTKFISVLLTKNGKVGNGD